MTIYLYVKTHAITGLKYLGKTKQKDPHEYLGSGTYWLRHLKTHGAAYTTEILQECQTNEEIKSWGLHYSELWDIVKSKEWANLKPEAGDGGGNRFKQTPDSIAKMLATKRANGTGKQSPESIAKGLATKKANGTLNTRTPESIAKGIAVRKANGSLKPSPENIAKRIATRRARGTLNTWTPERIAKQLATKEKNGTLNTWTPERIAKMMETKARNKALKGSPLAIDTPMQGDL